MKKHLVVAFVAVAIAMVWTVSSMAAPPVKIGCVNPLSGRVAFAGIPSKKTLDMMAEELNKAGGISGRPIELIHYDTEGKEDVTVRVFNRLIQKDEVTAVIDMPFFIILSAIAFLNSVTPSVVPYWRMLGPFSSRR